MSKKKKPDVILVNRCFVRGKNKRWLIVRRAFTGSKQSGKWEVPGGKVELDLDLLHELQREVLEEVGHYVHVVHPCVLAEKYLITDIPNEPVYVALISIAQVVGGRFALSKEHIDYRWVTYEEMLKYRLTSVVRKAARRLEHYLAS